MNPKQRRDHPIALIGAPTDVGAGRRGGSMGPEALRVAGIDAALRRLGYEVIDNGDISGPLNPNETPVSGYRHLKEVSAWCRLVSDAFHASLREGQFPILLGGDHSLSIGSIAGIAMFCAERNEPLSVLWLDAHADFNTLETTPSGNLHGMPVAVVTGRGPDMLSSMRDARALLNPNRIVQLGVRSIDRLEKTKIAESGLVVWDMRRIDEHGMRKTMEDALELLAGLGGHVHVSFDVDFLDPSIAPGVATAVRGGPTYREAQLCMEMIHDSGLMRSLDIMELNPAFDVRNMTGNLVVELVESLFGQQILSRYHFTL